MMWSSLFTVALATLPSAHAFPNMKDLLANIPHDSEVAARAVEIPGTSEAHNILNRKKPAHGDASTYTRPGEKDSQACAKDECCIWSFIASDMVAAFTDGNQCSALARGAIRLGFHDAGAWNSSLPSGGADGSILLSGELSRPENRGLQPIADQTNAWFNAYKKYGITMADLIQFGANVATVVCPRGPRIKTLIGRKDSTEEPPNGLLPSPFQEAPALIALFGAKTFSPAELVALVGAHTVSKQAFVDPRRAGAAQDSTPGVWDNIYYRETQSDRAPRDVFRFQSDISLARDGATSGVWSEFASRNGQATWAIAYAQAYFKMSLLGVKNLDELTDCTAVLPLPR